MSGVAVGVSVDVGSHEADNVGVPVGKKEPEGVTVADSRRAESEKPHLCCRRRQDIQKM